MLYATKQLNTIMHMFLLLSVTTFIAKLLILYVHPKCVQKVNKTCHAPIASGASNY